MTDPEVTRRKLDREIEQWRAQEPAYRARGWHLLSRDGDRLDLAFMAHLPLGPQAVPVIAACVQLDYADYPAQAPSLEFIDPITREYAPPVVPAVMQTPEGPRNLIVAAHPVTGRHFFCVPGIRQYHQHPQHSGDPWLLHLPTGAGSLATICDRVWLTMARPLIGLEVGIMTLPPEAPQQVQIQVRLVTGELQGDASAVALEQVAA